MNVKWLLSSLFTCSSLLFAVDKKEFIAQTPPLKPWLTGPLIAPIGAVVPYGSFEIQSYVYCTTNTGAYNKNWSTVSSPHNFFSLNPQFLLFFGLTSWMDINITPQFFYNRSHGQHSTQFGDLPIALDFQLLDPAATPYFPGIKLIVRETFPTGSFQNLTPHKLLTDQTGAGTFASAFNLLLYKVYHLGGHHFLSTTYSAGYTITSPVHVHGFNTYGGGYGTNGRALPGNSFQGIVSFELTLSKNWVLAIDNVYTHTDATQFYGTVGTTAAGLPATIGAPSSEQVSFAPAIEYNFSSNLGIIAGCWFTAWGRNSTQFRSGVINLDYTY
ncbi:MAG: hypothetical protein JSS32_07580 [Verrucomicrobia bacterium]|nr:hypothetical protein [Verrucomicrobiota bacterium]